MNPQLSSGNFPNTVWKIINCCLLQIYDELKRTEGDNPTIGIVLCDDTDEDIARYSVLHDNDHLFASKYMLYMPTPEQL